MKYVFTAIALFFALPCPAQNQRQPLRIRSMRVYQDTVRYGYSTGTALGHFDILKTRHVPTISASAAITDRLSKVLARAEARKQHQTKLGNRLMFAEMEVATDKISVHRLVISGIGGCATIVNSGVQARAVIVDLTTMRNYTVTDPADLVWLDALRTERLDPQD